MMSEVVDYFMTNHAHLKRAVGLVLLIFQLVNILRCEKENMNEQKRTDLKSCDYLQK